MLSLSHFLYALYLTSFSLHSHTNHALISFLLFFIMFSYNIKVGRDLVIVFNTSNITFICFSFLHFAFISHLSRSIFRYIPCYFYPFFNIQILIVIGTYITLHLTSISLYLHINYSLFTFIILSSSFFFSFIQKTNIH